MLQFLDPQTVLRCITLTDGLVYKTVRACADDACWMGCVCAKWSLLVLMLLANCGAVAPQVPADADGCWAAGVL